MSEILDLVRYAPAVAELLTPPRLAELGPVLPNLPLEKRLDQLTDRELFGGAAVIDDPMAEACRAALWLYHDFLDRSHELSQAIDTPTGSYWHGIMHRREQDFSNANYWFRRVGQHPIHGRLAEIAGRLARHQPGPLPAGIQSLENQQQWNYQAFTELCRSAQPSQPQPANYCRRLQQAEWELLFESCYHAAVGHSTSLPG